MKSEPEIRAYASDLLASLHAGVGPCDNPQCVNCEIVQQCSDVLLWAAGDLVPQIDADVENRAKFVRERE